MNYLYILTIPSVQTFISQARKTQDLYVGSQLLSDLVKIGAKAFKDKGGELIFPEGKAKTFTNRFLGEIKTKKADDESKDIEPEKIGENIEKKIREHLLEVAQDAVKKIVNTQALPKGFDEQIKNLLDIKWAFIEWNKETTSYEEAYKEIEKVIGAIKNVRTFKQFNYQKVFIKNDDNCESESKILNQEPIIGERGRKCSIDGERNVKFYRLTDSEKDENCVLEKKLFMDSPEEVCFVGNNVPIKYLDYGEGLSAVSFFKRCYIPERNNKNEVNFPSTAEITLKYVEHNNQEEFDKYKNLFDEKHFPTLLINHFEKLKIENYDQDFHKVDKKDFDYQLFYSENLNEKNIKNKIQLRWVKKWHSKFIKSIIGENKNRYYAIIVSDGDNMGKWLSGENLKPDADLLFFHKKLSENLNGFSEEAYKLLNEPEGKTVYSGGDDFMGFINLEYLFPVMNNIHEKFENINHDIKSIKQEDKKLTLSAGIAIAHYKTPLSIVLQKAREMEKLAKQNEKGNEKKNSFAIAVLKHSGEINQTVWKWKGDDGNYIPDSLKYIVDQLQDEKNGFSNTFITNLQIEFEKLQDKEGKLIVEKELLVTELKRLLKQSCKIRDKNKKKEATDKMFKNLEPLIPEKNENFNNFFMALNIADFIQRKTH